MRFALSGLLLPAMILLSGCATEWVDNYGVKSGYFVATGPAHGDMSQIYVQGKMDIFKGRCPPPSKHPVLESRPAYMAIEITLGRTLMENHYRQIVAKIVHEGDMPQAAFEFPEITQSPPPPTNKLYSDIFIASGQDIGTPDWKSLYVKNPNNPNSPTLIHLTDAKEYPRSTTNGIIANVMYPAAILVDAPFVVAGTLLFWVYVAFGGPIQ